ncbi:hypothetical protein [Thiosocius teredinicola]|uniref:hypothetical protein n=1 Tax=Thiosocius teredinicola TaxID=1973002 RepID=UPI002FE4F3E9
MMNIWALDKDESIKAVLLVLGDRLGIDHLQLSQRQDLDPRAVRLEKPGDPMICAYLYTYGQDEGRCGIHLEFPQFDESDISSSTDIHENVAINTLVDMLQVHFDLSDPSFVTTTATARQ